ncbi:MAG: Maf family protein [Chitinivibrionales bacterium]|nr:Maf family protein [Chitinivibrionales bacterium]
MRLWKTIDRRLVLASQSPRRKEILLALGLTFDIIPPRGVPEEPFIQSDDLAPSLRRLAVAKAQSVALGQSEALVLGADTVVALKAEVLGKPADKPAARRMLRKLSGKVHTVYTAVALLCNACAFAESAVAATTVYFRPLSETDVESYLTSNEYADKAGAYAIQGRAMEFVDKIEGCYYNVMGLPIRATIALFEHYQLRKETGNV